MPYRGPNDIRSAAAQRALFLLDPWQDPLEDLKQVTLSCDGSCDGPRGDAIGWGYVARFILPSGAEHVIERSGPIAEPNATNQRAELYAAIMVMRCLRYRCHVTLRSDSAYMLSGLKWMPKWRAKHWSVSNANLDLWKQLDDLVRQHDVHGQWIRSHSGDAYNTRVDFLARAALFSPQAAVKRSA